MSQNQVDPSEVQDAAARDADRWLLRIWLVVAAFAVVTFWRSAVVDIPIKDPHGSILVKRLAASLTLLLVLVLVDGVRRARPGGLSWERYVEVLRKRWTARRTAVAVSVVVAYHLIYLCYHNLKSWDAFNQPRDGMLLDWDKALFFGHSPAVLLHDLLGQDTSAHVLVFIYESFTAVVTLAVISSVVFPERLRHGAVFITAAIWVWILGVASYYLIPSLGPFNSAPQEFAGLPHTSVVDTQHLYMEQWRDLRAHPHENDEFAQVSAFASLHVALTTLTYLGARYYRLRRTSWALLAYVIGTMVATVYLGWHFFVDDIAGVIIALLGINLGRLTIYRSWRNPAEPHA